MCKQLWPQLAPEAALCAEALCLLRVHLAELGVVLQVEHGITEMVNRLDLVAWQLKLQCPGFKVGLHSRIAADCNSIWLLQWPN